MHVKPLPQFSKRLSTHRASELKYRGVYPSRIFAIVCSISWPCKGINGSRFSPNGLFKFPGPLLYNDLFKS